MIKSKNISVKENLVSSTKQVIKDSVIVANYSGVKSHDLNILRRQMRSKKALVKVVKNNLSKIIFKDTIYHDLCPEMTGQSIIVMPQEDNIGDVARSLVDFSKRSSLTIQCCALAGKIYSKEDIGFISSIPSKNDAINIMLSDLVSPLMLLFTHLESLAQQKLNQ